MQLEVSAAMMDIGRQIQEEFAQRVGRPRYELWFDANQVFEVADGALVVRLSDTFSMERVRDQFDADLRSVANRYEGVSGGIQYRLQEGPPPAPAPESAPLRKTQPPQPAQRNGSSRLAIECPGGVSGARRRGEAAFVFGQDHAIAASACGDVVENPGRISPLLVHGGVGCGKTRLLEMLHQRLHQQHRRLRSVSVTAEQFTSQFLEALSGRGLPLFRRKFREVQALLVDDVQFLARKKVTLVEFQSTLDHLLREGRQVILAADRPPADLAGFPKELIHRLSGGLVCRLNHPCRLSREAILKELCAERALPLAPRFVAMIAERLEGDGRQLTGAANRLHAARLSGFDLSDWEVVREVLRDVFDACRRPMSLEAIESAVSDFCGVGPEQLRSPSRSRRISAARNLAMWLARKHLGSPYSEIGLHYGGRSHSTVISAHRQVRGWLESGERIQVASGADCEARIALERIETRLRTG